MAKIFLSYAREDASRAERAAAALEAAGHKVWWDRDIGAGSSFSAEIDRELAGADLVVVLWSPHSVRSDWVRDEAAIGRDSGRLVPALIGKVEPPLGFRQYQAVSIQGRGGDERLVDSVARKLGQAARSPGRPVVPEFRLSRQVLLAGIALLFMLAAGSWWFLNRSDGGYTIAVIPAGAQSAELARSVALDLGRLRAGPIGSLTIIDPTAQDKDQAEFRVEIGQSGSGSDLRADVAMTQRGARGLLWSSVIEEPDGRSVDLRQQVSAQVSEVLNCLAELGDQRRSIKSQSLSLYLRGCSLGTTAEAIAVFRQLTQREPTFGPGWAALAMVSIWNVPVTLPSERRALIESAQAALERAQKYGPDLPETAVAFALMRPTGGAKEEATIRIMDSAIAKNPDSALLRATRAGALQAIGRMREAVEEFSRAKDLNPLSPALLDLHASALAYAGNVEAAYAALDAADRAWPGSSQLEEARFRFDLRFGDPKKAEAYLRRSGTNPGSDPNLVIAYLKARENPSPAMIEAALEGYRAKFRSSPGSSPGYASALATFGRVDEFFEAVKGDVAADSVGASTDVLFRPYFAKVRADPRFIHFAKRIGLVDVWQRLGVWPDFCSDATLAYDCKAEAEKVRSVVVMQPITG